MARVILDSAQKKSLRKDFKEKCKDGRLKKSAIHADLAREYGISTNYCANLVRAKRIK